MRKKIARCLVVMLCFVFLGQQVLWSFPEDTCSLRKMAAGENPSKPFLDGKPASPFSLDDEPFWYLAESACQRIDGEENQAEARRILSNVALTRGQDAEAVRMEAVKRLYALMRTDDGTSVAEQRAWDMVARAVSIGKRASTDHIPDVDFWDFLKQSTTVSTADMRERIAAFHEEMRKGLAGEASSLAMIPTFVGRPTGREQGTFLALDVGGTNVRWLKVVLVPGQKPVVITDGGEAIPKKDMIGAAKELFDFIAGRGRQFMNQQGISGTEGVVPTGFTWSYPVELLGINKGRHTGRGSKGLTAAGLDDADPVELLDRAFQRAGVETVRTDALCNDTVGTLMACLGQLGIIMGTGTNACYVEIMENIPKWEGAVPLSARSEGMIINIEWGNAGGRKKVGGKRVNEQAGFMPISPYDNQLDIASENPGEQILEKRTSGLYLGECVRLRCADAIRRAFLFDGKTCPVFNERGAFKSEFIDAIERDPTDNLAGVEELLKSWGITNSTLTDRYRLKNICELVSTAAARDMAWATAAVIMKNNPEVSRQYVAGVDGSLFEKHPYFAQRINEALEELLGPEKAKNIKLVLAKDGSGVGAAITAAVVSADYFEDGEQVDAARYVQVTPTLMVDRSRNDVYADLVSNGVWRKVVAPPDEVALTVQLRMFLTGTAVPYAGILITRGKAHQALLKHI